MIDTQIQWGLGRDNLSQNDKLFMFGFIVLDDRPIILNKNLFKEKIYFNMAMASDAIWLEPEPVKNCSALGNVFYPIKQFAPPIRRAILLEINGLNNHIPVTGPSIFNIHSKSDLIRFSFDQVIELQFQNEKPVTPELLTKSFTISSNL